MTWLEAIIKVLSAEGTPLHYSEITKKIIENGYRTSSELGATPDQTVYARLCTNKKLFEKVDAGVYRLSNCGAISKFEKQNTIKESKSEKKMEEKEELISQRNNIIKSFGMFWNRDDVDWKSMNLWGTQNGSPVKINFKKQIGIYLLHDAREVIYVGQAVKQSIVKRLADHCKDRLNGRWDRFSWFGFYGVNDNGDLITNDFPNTNFTIENVANAFEAVLIEGLEPRQNRKAGNEFGYEFLQAFDENLENKKQQIAIFKQLIEK